MSVKYPEKLINSTITRFIESRNQQQVRDVRAVASMRRTEALASVKFYQILSIFIFFIRLIILEDFIRLISYNGPCVRLGCSFFLATALDVQRNAPVRIILPFKDQRSADIVRRQLSDLGKKINSDIRPVFTSKKIADDIRVAEAKPPLTNQQCVVYKFKCDLCDADYVGYTRRHLFQRIDEHKHSAIGKHLRDSHNQKNKDLTEQFTILKKCRGKFECLIYEMLFIQEMKPKLNLNQTQ